MPDEPAVYVRYKGGGDKYVPGIPTRDLTEEEWLGLPVELRQVALESGTYVEAIRTKRIAKKESEQ